MYIYMYRHIHRKTIYIFEWRVPQCPRGRAPQAKRTIQTPPKTAREVPARLAARAPYWLECGDLVCRGNRIQAFWQ